VKFVCGEVAIDDVNRFVSDIDTIEEMANVAIQVFDARYIVDRQHIERAVECADRARRRDNNIARERSVEILLYAAGRRQITDALDVGVSTGLNRIVVVITGDDETGAADSIESSVVDDLDTEVLGSYDPDLVQSYFDITASEIDTVSGDIESIVLERVALLAVER
jgi:Uncharacterized conserved protein